MWPEVQRLAFNKSIAADIFFGEPVDDQYGPGVMTGRGKSTQSGGIKVQQRAEFGVSPNTQRQATRWSTYSTAPADLIRWLEANWVAYSDAVTISDQDRLENRGPNALGDMLASQTRNAMSSIVEFCVRDLYAGVLATGFTGLNTLINANNTVQGINGGTAAYNKWNSWGLSAKDTAAASVTFTSGSFATRGIADMRDAYSNCSYGNEQPQCILTTEDVVQFYEGSLVTQERYTAPADRGDAGFLSLAFKRVPVYGETYCTAGSMFFLNFNKLKCVFLEGADFQWQEPVRAGNQEATSTEIQAKGQLIVLDRRCQNKLISITA
jgi:hypothetical protein